MVCFITLPASSYPIQTSFSRRALLRIRVALYNKVTCILFSESFVKVNASPFLKVAVPVCNI